jgi:hypothetical protein
MSVPALWTTAERCGSVQLMVIIGRCQSSTEKNASCPALFEKCGRAGVGEDLPRFPRLSRACRQVQALPSPATGIRARRTRAQASQIAT